MKTTYHIYTPHEIDPPYTVKNPPYLVKMVDNNIEYYHLNKWYFSSYLTAYISRVRKGLIPITEEDALIAILTGMWRGGKIDGGK